MARDNFLGHYRCAPTGGAVIYYMAWMGGLIQADTAVFMSIVLGKYSGHIHVTSYAFPPPTVCANCNSRGGKYSGLIRSLVGWVLDATSVASSPCLNSGVCHNLPNSYTLLEQQRRLPWKYFSSCVSSRLQDALP